MEIKITALGKHQGDMVYEVVAMKDENEGVKSVCRVPEDYYDSIRKSQDFIINAWHELMPHVDAVITEAMREEAG